IPLETDDTYGHRVGYLPHLAVDRRGVVIAVWDQSDGAQSHIWSRCFVPGSGWGAPTMVENKAAVAGNPRVAVDGAGNATVVWMQFDGAENRSDIWASRFVPGAGW